MYLSELWKLYEVDKRIQGFSPYILKAYSLQLKMLVGELGDLEIEEITLLELRTSYQICALPFSLCLSRRLPYAKCLS
ncbi:hypothetical protein [Paenibacillus antarcticus]|uniref:Core-binding (CB) domain-containing protein n=1 Tax=Paenibacillus antarcticus TaxID=253703 RepID=A0A168KLC9_9BACL|nr:hypothetical protein [Paenibacillus antarcticus]OAB42172.1 hypothetical protein PBAT_20350 [Paenibacillus antarcticus]